jgi:hypothetical protein
MSQPPLPPPSSEESLFARALELPAAERGAYLDQACAGDAILRARVEELLRAEDSAGFMAAPAAGLEATIARPAPLPEEKPGDRIGRYKLLQKIGEGGCGVVYMAEQQEPVVRRVALKVTKLGMDTKEVIARFEAERQALAVMDHPNIARVLDGGATEAGRPFFVMELVRGVPIAKYCDEQNLSTAARLELFTNVCHAVQHAHQKGIIHCDLDLARDGRRVMAEAGLLVGGILLILGVALGLINFLIDAQIPDAIAQWSLAHAPSRWVSLLGLNIALVFVGGLVEIYAAIIVVVPLLAPLGAQPGIDPVHLGVIFLANMELGFLAPPVGLNLLLASSRLRKPLNDVALAVLPVLSVMFLGVLLITYLPALTTWLPRLFAR